MHALLYRPLNPSPHTHFASFFLSFSGGPCLQERLAYLKRVRSEGDVVEVMFAVRADLLRNLANMTSRWVGRR